MVQLSYKFNKQLDQICTNLQHYTLLQQFDQFRAQVLKQSMEKKQQLRLSDQQAFQSPLKGKFNSQFHEQSLFQTHRKSIQNDQSNSFSIKTVKGLSDGKNKTVFHRTIQYSNLKLLDKTRDNLMNIRQQMMIHFENREELELQLNKRLKKTFVIYCRINNIKTQLNKYIIECVDQTNSSMQLTYIRPFNTSLLAQVQFSNRKFDPNEKSDNLTSITDLNSLQYEPRQNFGHSYFELIVNFKQLPIYSKEFTFMKEKPHELNADGETQTSLSINNNKKIMGYEVNVMIESLRQVKNYNLITLCHANTILQNIYSENSTYYEENEEDYVAK